MDDLDEGATPRRPTVLTMEPSTTGGADGAIAAEPEPIGDADAATELDTTNEPAFRRLVANTLLSGVTSSFLWFALTFWVYLETKSVVATGIVGGAFGLAGAVIGPAFGTYVDHHRKHGAMMLATSTSAVCFGIAAVVYLAVDHVTVLSLGLPYFWILVAATLLGSVAGNVRGVALSTCVTMLVPEHRRDRANGLVGTVTGISFAITSVFSGLVIGLLGMGWALAISVVLTAAALAHLASIRFAERPPEPAADGASHIDLRAAVEAIKAVPGLWMLIFLAAFNNLLAGVFMALMDAYGLELVSVEIWGVLWMFISFAMILGGLAVARFGLGRSPVRVILIGNLINWTMCSVFTLRSSIVLVTLGMVVWLALIPMIEAAEQTVLQRVIPFERQGRVFGFAQLVENAASPLTAFLIGPLAQTVVMPFMSDGGAGAAAIGSWFGTGPARGLALLFTLAGLLGVVVTLAVWGSRSYRRLADGERAAALAAA
jgi:MFS transporter, DHA3 family, multidrug efflux protein